MFRLEAELSKRRQRKAAPLAKIVGDSPKYPPKAATSHPHNSTPPKRSKPSTFSHDHRLIPIFIEFLIQRRIGGPYILPVASEPHSNQPANEASPFQDENNGVLSLSSISPQPFLSLSILAPPELFYSINCGFELIKKKIILPSPPLQLSAFGPENKTLCSSARCEISPRISLVALEN